MQEKLSIIFLQGWLKKNSNETEELIFIPEISPIDAAKVLFSAYIQNRNYELPPGFIASLIDDVPNISIKPELNSVKNQDAKNLIGFWGETTFYHYLKFNYNYKYKFLGHNTFSSEQVNMSIKNSNDKSRSFDIEFPNKGKYEEYVQQSKVSSSERTHYDIKVTKKLFTNQNHAKTKVCFFELKTTSKDIEEQSIINFTAAENKFMFDYNSNHEEKPNRYHLVRIFNAGKDSFKCKKLTCRN